MEGFFQITENRLVIDGVNGEHIFLHVSDTHICVSDALSTADETDKAAKQEKAWDDVKRGFAHHFGEPFNPEHDIPSTEAFCKLMEYAKTQKPEKLLLSGDVIDYISPAAIRFLAKKLNEYGSEYIFVPGNHEGRLDKHPELIPFSHGDSVQIYNGGGFIIAGVDNSEKTVSDKQLGELEKLLMGKTPVVLLMHIPIATEMNSSEMKKFDDYYVISDKLTDKNALKFLSLVRRPDSAVKAILCGHVHGYHFSYFAEGKPQICASSGMVGFVHKFTISGT